MASSSSNPHITLEIEEEEYPYPSHVCAPNFVTFKLSCKDEYRIWKTQTLCLLKSHAMLGFIDGTLVSPQRIVSGKEKVGDPNIHWLWTRSDSLVKGWILGSLSKETLGCVLDRLTDQQTEADCSAMDVWNELQTMYGHAVLPQLPPVVAGIFYLIFLFPRILKMLVRPFIIKRVQVHADAMELLETVCRRIKHKNDPNSFHRCYTNPIFEAIRENAYEVVHWIVPFFKNAIWSTNKDGHNIIQYAVINRSEKVYNLLYHMSDHKNIYRTIKDSSGNNLLHLAARLAPTNKLNLISGAALQIQSELQWFKEVEGFVCPLNIKQKNSFDETPQMVFTREHKELVIEGEKWMKATAESYTITAALITTIVFAAAITVPGGNNQDTGIPLFTNHTAFTIFAISDAISLFAAVTSLLMFLSILTARFAEQDFLFKLPTKLIIGLATLFISTTAMIIAFGATLYLVFGQRNSRILTPIVVLTCLPITSFVTLQFPLIIDLVSATYGRRIFGKKYVAYSKDSLERMKRPFY